MRSALRRAYPALAAAGLLLLAGCGLGLETPLRLVTNRAELAAYVDRFNSMQSDVRWISYQESPAQSFWTGGRES